MNLSQLLFDTPWWLPTSIALAGVVLFFYANARREWKLRNAGAGVGLLAILLAAISYAVDTDIEKVVKRTKQFVTAVNERDWTTFRSLLDTRTSFAMYRNADELTSGAEKTSDAIGLKSVTVFSMEPQQTDTLITVYLAVWSTQDFTMLRPIKSNWQFDWQETSEGWVLRTIRPLGGDSLKPSDVEAKLKAP